MTLLKSLRVSFFLSIVVLSIASGSSRVFSAGESLQIVNLSPTGAVSANTTVTFYAAASGFTDPAFTLTDSFNATGATIGTIDKFGYFTWTPGVYDAGKHAITIVATDGLNHSATSTTSILVSSNTIVISNLSPGPIVQLFRPITFTITAPGFISPSYNIYQPSSVSSLNGGNIDSTGLFSWTPKYDDLGTHPFTIVATDAYGHSAQTNETLTVINPTVSIQSLNPSSTIGVGSQVTFQTNAPTLTSPSFSVSDLFSGTSTITSNTINATGTFAWTPTLTDIGTHLLTVTAADTYGNATSTTATISVIAAPTTIAAPLPVLLETNATATSTITIPQSGATIVSPSATKNYVFTASLAIGSRNAAVLELQKRLTTLGFYSGPLTGYFGLMTSVGVKKFQSAHGISSIGIVGPATRAALNS
jgi:hypothetical protein